MNKGMCPPLSDLDFFNLLTEYGTKLVDLVIKHYPELEIYKNNERDLLV